MVFFIPSASRVLMLLSQLERLNEEPKVSDNDAIRQITGKILHLIQTQGDHTHTHAYTQTHTKKMHSYSERDHHLHTGVDWDKMSGREISHSSRPSHTPTTNSETWTTLLAYLYDHHIKRSKSLVRVVENN